MRVCSLGTIFSIALALPRIGLAIDDNVTVHGPEPARGPYLTLSVNGQTPNGGNEVELTAWQRVGNTIRLYVDWNMGDLTVVTNYHYTFAIPVPPTGTYTILYFARRTPGEEFQQVASTSFEVLPRWPSRSYTGFIWPPDPKPLDRVTYFFTPFSSCQPEVIGVATVNNDDDGDGVFEDSVNVIQTSEPCGLVTIPRLQSIALGKLEPGRHELSAWYQFQDLTLDPIPPLDFRIFEVPAKLPGRLSGSWYNPAQDGHGLSLEVLDSGERLLAYWFTFDANGDQAWLLAMGEVNDAGNGATLEASLFEGGRFPPAFDPGDVSGQAWGTLTLEFDDCSRGEMSWDTTHAEFSDGSMPIERLTEISNYGCATQPPESLLEDDWRLTPFPVFEESEEAPVGASSR